MTEIDESRKATRSTTNAACSASSAAGRGAVVTLGLHALQHRGQEAAGIVSFDGEQFFVERHIGLIGDTFTKQA